MVETKNQKSLTTKRDILQSCQESVGIRKLNNKNMVKDLENKDIRSDKVRNIMVEKPPVLISYGTAQIATLDLL